MDLISKNEDLKKVTRHSFPKGYVPPNKKILTDEEEQYLRENYNRVTKTVLAEKLGIHRLSVLKLMNKMGLKRSKEEIKFLISQRVKPKHNTKLLKIEGSTESSKNRWHLSKWQKINGKIPGNKHMLYYKTVGLFESLELIRKRSFNKLVRLRDNLPLPKKQKIQVGPSKRELRKQLTLENKQKKRNEIETRKAQRHQQSISKKQEYKDSVAKRKLERAQNAELKKLQTKANAEQRRKEREEKNLKHKNEKEAKEQERLRIKEEKINAKETEKKKKQKEKKDKIRERELKWCEAKLKEDVPEIDTTYHTFEEHLEKDINEGKVPVRLNHKTIIFVSREKCIKDEAGNWAKK